MQNFSWYISRLRSMGPAEIAWRVKGLISANVDLLRIPMGLVPTLRRGAVAGPPDFRPGFACAPASTAFAGVDDDVARRWRERLRRIADEICDNRLSFFDLEGQHVGDPPNWHHDFAAGKDSPRRLSSLLDYRDFEAAGDCKLVWEPNRHHQLVVLARAYRVTGDKRYAHKVVELMLHWIQENPFGYGMNWKSPLEVGIRLINWVWAIDLIRDAAVFDDTAWGKVVQTIYRATWDTQRKFSQGSSANNHLIGEAAGVYIACCYFPDLPNARAWRATSKGILEREMIAQTFADGCSREHAFGYQFFVIQFFTCSLLAGERTDDAFSATFRDRLHAIYRFMADLCADTGQPPNFGDADDGYVLDLGERPRRALQLLSVGGYLFDDPDLVLAADSETAWWLFGKAGQAVCADKSDASKAYNESGYFILRCAAQGSRPPVRVFFDCAELGFGAIAAHGHADCLSFSLAVAGREVLVDPGTYDYFSYPEWRRYFRTTAAHNTLTVDGEDQSESLGPFIWGQRAEARLVDWQSSATAVSVTGEHSGYQRLPDPVLHRRRVSLNKDDSSIEIRDSVQAGSAHALAAHFHVAPGWHVTAPSARLVEITGHGVRLRLASADGSLRVLAADGGQRLGWVSDGYHRMAAGHCIVLDAKSTGDAELVTRIAIGV
ncbi:MAG: heparinase II/III family protein [Gammaproteobacteria bacterium]|nr:heparinase II/III family protein [Gammaproteobacteria bacterium]